jgi:invasion protein IalB
MAPENCGTCRAKRGLGSSELEWLHDTTGMHGRRFCNAAVLVLISCAQAPNLSLAAGGQKFRADEWITECDSGPSSGAADCSITVPFWQSQGNQKGSFALVIMLQTGNIGIVGQPFPIRAALRVDKNPPVECRQARYCVFPSIQALAVLKQLKVGSLILIDVFTDKGVFNFSLTPKGYQAGVAQIRAWGYRTQ